MLNIRISKYSRIISAVNALLALAVIIAALFLVRNIISISLRKADKDIAPASAAPQSHKANFNDYEAILKNNPFGFDGGALRLLSDSGGASIARSDIKLIGTVAGPQAHSFAIFADKSGRQEVYKINDSVFGIGNLKRVYAEKVSISGKGRVIEIPLADSLTIRESDMTGGSGGTADFVKSMGSGSFIVDQKKILNALENPNQLMTDARLLPNFVNGKQEGFIMREVKTSGIYQSLGLQNGDVLLRINDYNITNPENALQAFTALRGMDRVQLDIMRNNAKMTLTYQIR